MSPIGIPCGEYAPEILRDDGMRFYTTSGIKKHLHLSKTTSLTYVPPKINVLAPTNLNIADWALLSRFQHSERFEGGRGGDVTDDCCALGSQRGS